MGCSRAARLQVQGSRTLRSARGAQGPEVQGTLEGAEIVVLSSASIASTKEVELSTNFLELIRKAGKRDADWQATKEAVLKKSENGLKSLRSRTTYYSVRSMGDGRPPDEDGSRYTPVHEREYRSGHQAVDVDSLPSADRWSNREDLLPLAEHAYNTAVSETTKMSPFFANYGYQPETQ
jgi:hypothetical protein